MVAVLGAKVWQREKEVWAKLRINWNKQRCASIRISKAAHSLGIRRCRRQCMVLY